MNPPLETAIFGGGCFWCTEAIFTRLRGVASVTSGYAGGSLIDPDYAAVSSGTTGHAEVVQLKFDPSQISYSQLLEVFFALHDPTTPDQQGHDVGPQYRSLILYTSPHQQQTATAYLDQLSASGHYSRPPVTQILPAGHFYTAEEYHQRYYEQHSSQPYCQFVIRPKLDQLTARFSHLLQDSST